MAGGFLLIIAMLVFFAYHQRQFVVQLEPDGTVRISKGAFFFQGWHFVRSLRIGLEPGWHRELGDEPLAKSLETGLKVLDGHQLQAVLLDLLQRLARNASRGRDEETLTEALYYYSQVAQQNNSPQIRHAMAQVRLRIANVQSSEGRYREAKNTLVETKGLGIDQQVQAALKTVNKALTAQQEAAGAGIPEEADGD